MVAILSKGGGGGGGELETHGCILSLNTSIHSAYRIVFVLDRFHTKISSLQWIICENKLHFGEKNYPCFIGGLCLMSYHHNFSAGSSWPTECILDLSCATDSLGVITLTSWTCSFRSHYDIIRYHRNIVALDGFSCRCDVVFSNSIIINVATNLIMIIMLGTVATLVVSNGSCRYPVAVAVVASWYWHIIRLFWYLTPPRIFPLREIGLNVAISIVLMAAINMNSWACPAADGVWTRMWG